MKSSRLRSFLFVPLLVVVFLVFWMVQTGSIIRPSAPPDLNNGLTGFWSFNQNDISSTTSYIHSGQVKHGMRVNGAQQTAGRIEQALEFDGVDDYVLTDTLSKFISASTGTIAVWMKPIGAPLTGKSFQLPAAVADVGGFAGIHRGINNGDDRIWVYNWDGNEDGIGISYTVDEWVHIVWVHDGGVLYAYKNGVLAGSTPSGDTVELTHTLAIGDGLQHNAKFIGSIDDVRIYNRMLSQQEVTHLYHMGAPPEVDASQKHTNGFRGSRRLTTGIAGTIIWAR
jgi:hypothetical protein